MRRAMILLRRSPYRRRAGRGRSCRAVVSTDPNPRRRRGGLREAAPSSGSVLGDGAAGGDDLLLGRRREGVGRDVELDAQVAGAEHLDLVARAHRALAHEVLDRHGAALGEQLAQLVQVHDLVLDAERVLEAAQLGQPHVQRRLPALEARGHLVTGLRALGAAARGLAALAALTTTDAGL